MADNAVEVLKCTNGGILGRYLSLYIAASSDALTLCEVEVFGYSGNILQQYLLYIISSISSIHSSIPSIHYFINIFYTLLHQYLLYITSSISSIHYFINIFYTLFHQYLLHITSSISSIYYFNNISIITIFYYTVIAIITTSLLPIIQYVVKVPSAL